MNVPHVCKWCVVATLAALGANSGVHNAVAEQPSPVGVEQGVQVLTRGPVHEAFAETVTTFGKERAPPKAYEAPKLDPNLVAKPRVNRSPGQPQQHTVSRVPLDQPQPTAPQPQPKAAARPAAQPQPRVERLAPKPQPKVERPTPQPQPQPKVDRPTPQPATGPPSAGPNQDKEKEKGKGK
jgi:hypothetical protein